MKVGLRVWVLAGVMALAAALPVAAQQLGYVSKYIGSEAEFAYIWQGRNGAKESLRFRLPIEDLQRGAVEFGGYQYNDLKKLLNEGMRKEAVALSGQGVSVATVPAMGGGVTLKMSGDPRILNAERIEQIKARMQAVQDEVQAQYLKDNWYRRMEDERIMPDHPRLVRRYAPALAPVVAAIQAQTAGRSQREVIDYVMGWLQTMPYDTLMNRYSTGVGGGAGYQTPYGLILNNKGDCDTKSVALLAIVHALYPQAPLAMVYVPDHAFAAVGMAQGDNDYALRIGGNVMVLADPTGPALHVLGEVEPRAKAVLKAEKGWHLAI